MFIVLPLLMAIGNVLGRIFETWNESYEDEKEEQR